MLIKYCEKCKKELELLDIFDTEGGILNGYLIEKQIWFCKDCGQKYLINLKTYIKEDDYIQTYFQKAW